MSEFTASALPRAFKCLASITHEQAAFHTVDAELGKERHAKQETAIKAGDLSLLPEALQLMIEGMEVRAEVAMAINTATGAARLLGYGIERDYTGLDPFEVAGTTDLLAVGQGRVIIADKKGFRAVEHPSENKQTLHNALCAARLYKVSEVTVCIHGEIGEPKFAVLDAVDLDAFAAELRELQVRAARAKQDPRPFEVEGSHCEYCQGHERCSKKNALAFAANTGAIDNMLAATLALEDDETAARMYVLGQRLGDLAKRVNARVYARAAERPIPVGNGKLFGKTLKPGKRELDAKVAVRAIRDVLGDKADAFEAIAIERSTSQAAIERAAQLLAGKGKIGKTKDSVIARIDELGGIERGKSTETFEEYPALPAATNNTRNQGDAS